MFPRNVMIQKIFEHIPFTYKGVNRNGEHIVQLDMYNSTVYATLERLSNLELNKIACKLKILAQEEAT